MKNVKTDFTVEESVCSKANGSDELNECWILKTRGYGTDYSNS